MAKQLRGPHNAVRTQDRRRGRKLRHFALIAFAVITGACARLPEGTARAPTDPARSVIYHNGTVLTMDAALPAAEAIATRGETIEAVGTEEQILALAGPQTVLVDLEGRTLMPGFVDAHTHILNDHRSEGMSLDEAQSLALRNGITSLGNLYVDEDFLQEMQDFESAGFLRVRSSLYLVATGPCGEVYGDWWKQYPPTRSPGEMLRIGGIKIFTDGGSCGKVALSFELEPGWGEGDLWLSQEELNELVAEVQAAGYQAAVHAIGDRAVEQALNAIELALDGQPNTYRHRMEHVSVIRPEQLPRFGELGVIPVLSGQYPNCVPFGPPIPEGYREWEWPWRALREINPGLPIAWHSDVPFLSDDPFDHLLGFVTRTEVQGRAVCPPEDWLRDDTLPVEEALAIMTLQSAYALGRDEEVGSLVPGKLADLIVLTANPLTAQINRLGDIQVLLTVVGGQTEYCRPAVAELCPGFANRNPAPLPDTRPPVFVRWLVAVLLAALPPAGLMLGRRDRWAIGVRRLGGASGVIAGGIWLVILFNERWIDDSIILLFLLPPFLMALGVAGIAAGARPGKLGWLGLALAMLGAITISEGSVVGDWFQSDAGWGMFLFGLLAHAMGLFLVGLANLQGRMLPWFNALPILIGLLGGPVPLGLSFILPESSDFPFQLLLIALGGGWVMVGGILLLASRAAIAAEIGRDTGHEPIA